MELHFRAIFYYFLFFSFISQTYSVRVLLDEKDKKDNSCWTISSANEIFLQNPITNQLSKKSFKKLVIEYRENGIYVNSKSCPLDYLACEPVDGPLVFDGRSYNGVFYLKVFNKKLLLINALDIEDYVSCVLKTESWPGWPTEANKVMAIVCRSYALSKIIEARKSKKPYHIKNTNAHQTYHGICKSMHLREAVDQTHYLFLSYNKMPILAMYDSSCGGVIPGKISGVDFRSSPYLARMYPCTYCSSYKIFSWRIIYTARELASLLSDEENLIKEIKDMTVVSRDAAGLVKSVAVVTNKKTIYFSGKNLHSLIKKIKSFVFSITKKSHTFVFDGYGYGHHLGLCQWGARELVARGWSYGDILDFYYPKTRIMKLKDV